jgi:methionyl-tRNA formyltransferase
MDKQHITVLVDNESWVLPYAQRLIFALRDAGYAADLVRSVSAIKPGWINFMLGCTQIISPKVLGLNKYNLVVHESALPQGRGFAPMTWQIIQGKTSIPICLLEASTEVDSGDVWLRDIIELNGSELCDEWRALQGEKSIQLCLRFVSDNQKLTPEKQVGDASCYDRRRSEDSRIDPDKTLREQFVQLQVADNVRYPAFFDMSGQRYIIHIFKDKAHDGEE